MIDGQQRLTRLTILLAVLRDLTDDPGLRADIEPFIAEPGSRVRGLAAKPRLTLRPRDNEFFSTWVQTTGAIAELLALKPDALATDAQRAVQANSAAIREVLAEVRPALRPPARPICPTAPAWVRGPPSAIVGRAG